MTELTQIDDRKFMINFGPQHSVVLRALSSVCVALMLVGCATVSVAQASSDSEEAKIMNTEADHLIVVVADQLTHVASVYALNCYMASVVQMKAVSNKNNKVFNNKVFKVSELGARMWGEVYKRKAVSENLNFNKVSEETALAKNARNKTLSPKLRGKVVHDVILKCLKDSNVALEAVRANKLLEQDD